MTAAQQWRAEGSGSGHMQAIVTIDEARVDEAYRAFITHAGDCSPCRVTGTDCETAAGLRTAWRTSREQT